MAAETRCQLETQKIDRLQELARTCRNQELVAGFDELLLERGTILEFLHRVLQRLGRHPKLADDHDPSGDGLIQRIQEFLGTSDKST